MKVLGWILAVLGLLGLIGGISNLATGASGFRTDHEAGKTLSGFAFGFLMFAGGLSLALKRDTKK